MTVAGKIHTFAVGVVVIASLLLCSGAIYSEYLYAREQLIERAYFQVQSKPQLPVAIYNENKRQQVVMLGALLESSEAIRFVRLLDSHGKETISLLQSNAESYPPLSLPTLRGDAAATETNLTERHTDIAPYGHELAALILRGDHLWDLVVPVLSLVNPLQKDLTAADFGAALASSGESGSLHVIGYVHVGISRTMLWASRAHVMSLIALACAALALIGILLSRIVTRRITAPFSTIVGMAEDIVTGREVRTSRLEGNGEFAGLVTLLHGIVGDFKSRTTKMEVDQQLLSMKVMERTSQLSNRNEELNKAVREVTKTRDRLHKLAYYDSLTSLPNRRLFTEQLDLLLRLAKRRGEIIGLLFLDLDNFKRINDSLGHVAGDLLLRETAKRLARCVRDSDVLAHYVEPDSKINVSRLGGDEFTVVLNQLSDKRAAQVVAQRLLDVLREPMLIEGHEIVVTPSIGIAIAPDDADSVEGLLKAADTAMYHAKGEGKNVFRRYSEEMQATGVELLQLESDLRKAVERKELVLHYQPQVDTMTGNVVGAEALMRWEHPEKGLIPPFKFISLAEEMGLIGAIGEWALLEACRQLVTLQTEGITLPKVSVNVSALQFNPTFIGRVAQILSETGLRPSRLELELTEGIMMAGDEATMDAVQRLKALGVRLSIDDFGTGYSSLSYLSRFPLDELKIDRSFVVSMENNENDANLVIAIIAMAKSLKLELVAEGVETEDQYRFLRRHGTNVIQGYMFSKPLPINELKPLLAEGHFREHIAQMTPAS